jgi:hypothetical protein
MAASGLSRAVRLLVASAVVLPGLVLMSATAEAAGTGAQTASSVLTAAKSAIGKQTSVHLEVKSGSGSGSGSSEEDLKADLGKTSGIETISEGTETVVIKVTPTDAYLSGDSSGLTKILGLTSAEAKKVGSDWLTLKAGTSQYKTLATSVTVSSVGSILPPAKGTHLYAPAPPTKKFYTLKWNTAATSSSPALTSSLTLSAVGATLPALETTTAVGAGKQTVALSKWGEHVLVSAPPEGSTIPLSKISG